MRGPDCIIDERHDHADHIMAVCNGQPLLLVVLGLIHRCHTLMSVHTEGPVAQTSSIPPCLSCTDSITRPGVSAQCACTAARTNRPTSDMCRHMAAVLKCISMASASLSATIRGGERAVSSARLPSPSHSHLDSHSSHASLLCPYLSFPLRRTASSAGRTDHPHTHETDQTTAAYHTPHTQSRWR